MIVFGLNRIRDPRAEDAAISLLDDEDVKLHAVITLGKMKSKKALPLLEPLPASRRAGITKEARKAIRKITR
jgi:HEAT repeat protein